jgi:L-threonylcarbamoyladenylate synthase
VGVRIPNHKLALRLLREAAVPVAAPSANRFGHVSPTAAIHVYNDLKESDICILNSDAEAVCSVGIESTVCKIDTKCKELVIFRRGGVSTEAIHEVLLKNGILDYSITVLSKKASHAPDAEAQQAPGQMLTHYAPDVDTYLVSNLDLEEDVLVPTSPFDISKAVVVDFGGRLGALSKACIGYRDLSPSGSVPEAAKTLFNTLRWSEEIPGAQVVLLPNLTAYDLKDEMAAAVYDRLFRAASGRFVRCKKHGSSFGILRDSI